MDTRNEFKISRQRLSPCQRCHEAASIVATEAGLAHRQKRKRPEQSLAFKWVWYVATITATPTAFRPWG